MKAKSYNGLSGGALLKKAPPTLREQMTLRRFEKDAGPFTLLVFPCQRTNRILSGSVKHILAKTLPGERLVAVGGCFTLESLALLHEHSAEVFALSDYPWSDEGYLHIRDVIASPVKFPLQ